MLVCRKAETGKKLLRLSEMCGRLPACRFTGRSRPCFGRQEYVFGVAQICNLLYRRIAFCGTMVSASGLELSDALPITNRRYGRLQICATRPRCALNKYDVGSTLLVHTFSLRKFTVRGRRQMRHGAPSVETTTFDPVEKPVDPPNDGCYFGRRCIKWPQCFRPFA